MHVKKGDTVVVLAGDDRGKIGRVLKIMPNKNRVIVEGVNFIIRHTRPSQTNPQGGRVEKEAPIHASNVAIVDSSE
jgi:large subunit ribosomal protein L24